jgi:hypothetical protein
MSDRKFWIRRDREQYFLSGVIITCILGGFISSYWHFTDRITVRQDIKIKDRKTHESEQKKLKDLQYTPSKLKVGSTQYYRMDNDTIPSVPKLGENEGN